MFAERKRRQFSYIWSLPLVVTIMFVFVAKLAALQRAELIAEFADQVAHSDTDEATSAVRHLAAMPRPPVAILVEAAASPNLDVAQEAQFSVDNYLRYCQRQIKAGRRTKVVAAQLTVLAKSLSEQHQSFSIVDYPWIERTTRKVLQLANGIPSRGTPAVAAHCEEVLAIVTARISPLASPATTLALGGKPPVTVSAGDEEGLAILAAHPWSRHPGIGANMPTTNELTPHASADARSNRFSVSLQPPLPRSAAPGFEVADDYAMSIPPDGASDSGWQVQWSHPMLSALPAMPIDAAPISGSRNELRTSAAKTWTGRIASIPEAAASERRFRDIESRSLLERWLVAEGTDVFPLEQELTQRGFGRLSARLVRQLFSDQPEDRLRLVDDVLTEPGVDARPWLLLLSDDTDPDVRLVVVTIMATSNDSTLIEAAWQVAIRDRDPRIAGMAACLRERRNDSQRR